MPGFGTHTQTTAVPLIGSGMPTTAASSSSPVPISSASISDGPVRLPAIFSVSSLRPCTYHHMPSRLRHWRLAKSPWHPQARQLRPVALPK